MERGITDIHGGGDDGVDPALIYDTLAREREADTDLYDVPATQHLRQRRPLVLQPGDRCPGCHVTVVDLDTAHLDSCFYQGRNAAILAVAS